MVEFIARLETIDQDFLFIANKIGSKNKFQLFVLFEDNNLII